MDADNKVGSSIEVEFDSPQAGPHTLGIRLAHGKPDVRPAEVRVNGHVVNPSLDFGTTGHWTAWTTKNNSVELKAGKNTIRLTALRPEGLVNTDHFALTPNS